MPYGGKGAVDAAPQWSLEFVSLADPDSCNPQASRNQGARTTTSVAARSVVAELYVEAHAGPRAGPTGRGVIFRRLRYGVFLHARLSSGPRGVMGSRPDRKHGQLRTRKPTRHWRECGRRGPRVAPATTNATFFRRNNTEMIEIESACCSHGSRTHKTHTNYWANKFIGPHAATLAAAAEQTPPCYM